MACSSGAKTRSVPSWPSTLIAAATSAVRRSIRRSAIAMTSMPSMPSVPLMRASPSLATSSTGVSPAAASASAAGISVPDGVAHLALAHQRERAVRQGRQVAGAAEGAVLPDDRRDAVGQQAGQELRGLPAYAGVSGRQRREPQQHQRAHHLALDLRTRAGRVRADEGALELGTHLGGDVPGGERAEAGADAVRRRLGSCQRLDDAAGMVDRHQRLVGQLDRGTVAGDADEVVERDGTDAHLDGPCAVAGGLHARHPTPGCTA